MTKKTTAPITLAALIVLAMPSMAAAYVDPGSGAVIWQLAAATVLGSLFQVRRIARWIRARLTRTGATTETTSMPER
jgi:hypothetical protein